ncbi:MAG: chromosome segregation in meiosis- protein [Pycnora praestabilis]|nr:MAG: chromosome segregation in meiosis- protein [Pycnora praestabilis]
MVSADTDPYMDSYLNGLDSPEPPTRTRDIVAPAPPDDLDDLFNYDAGMDDALRSANTATNDGAKSTLKKNGATLGIDEEIKVTKKRRPTVKLDENRSNGSTNMNGRVRLLSQAGIPKLRKTCKERLKFKGKGHEYKDASRILNFYQLWLDDLFPRAKLADGLAIIEKLGHTKRMQVMRKEWIDEGKSKLTVADVGVVGEAGSHGGQRTQDTLKRGSAALETDGGRGGSHASIQRTERPRTPSRTNTIVNDDLYRVTPTADRDPPPNPTKPTSQDDSLFIPSNSPPANQPSDDELGALLAEEDAAMGLNQDAEAENWGVSSATANTAKAASNDEFDDDMEAMADVVGDDLW